jgi:hypothetical protein
MAGSGRAGRLHLRQIRRDPAQGLPDSAVKLSPDGVIPGSPARFAGDRGGDDGRLVIDARTGRIIRFIPAYWMGDNFNEDLNAAYGPIRPLPPLTAMRAASHVRRCRYHTSPAAPERRCRKRRTPPEPKRRRSNRRQRRNQPSSRHRRHQPRPARQNLRCRSCRRGKCRTRRDLIKRRAKIRRQ